MQAPGWEHRLAEEMLDLRSELHQLGRRSDRRSGVLGRGQIRDCVGHAPVILRGQEPLGAKQIVVKKFCVRKRAAYVDEEFQHLGVVQRAPAWQGNLKEPKSNFIGVGNPLANRLTLPFLEIEKRWLFQQLARELP